MHETKWFYTTVLLAFLAGIVLLAYKILGCGAVFYPLHYEQQMGSVVGSTLTKAIPFDLRNLPADTLSNLRFLVLLPLGAAVTLFFRNYIGAPSFGVFLPILLSIVFLEMQALWATIFILMTSFFSVLVKIYFERLQILIVPRISAVFVLLILFITSFFLFVFHLGLQNLSSIGLSSLVIVMLFNEKLCDFWEEFGPHDAIKTAAGTFAIALLSYFVMKHAYIQYLAMVFPELNLIILAVILILGQYRGYRFTELKRFQTLCKNQSK